MTDPLVEKLRKISTAIYIATSEEVAEDVSYSIIQAIDRIEELELENEQLLNRIDELSLWVYERR